ncbi:MAG: transcription elongation factor, partial [Chitinophagaceae bacterium]|nr:transcription elongation factor [Chitinophagaceae bacterium]
MSFKQNIVHHYHQLINDKIVSLTNALNDLRESSKNETKSSAGDKYET